MNLTSKLKFIASLLALLVAACGPAEEDGALGELEASLSTPVLHGAKFVANPTATALSVPRPAGAVAGDLLLAQISVRAQPTITAPSGWTRLRVDVAGGTVTQALYWKLAGSAEPTSYTWRFSSSLPAAGGILAYGGVDQSKPISAHSGRGNGKSNQLTAPGLTAPAGARLVALFAAMPENTISPPSGMTERGEAASTAGRYEVTAAAADQAFTAGGATGNRVAKSRYAHYNVGQLVALAPASTSSAPPPQDAGTSAADAGTSTPDAGTVTPPPPTGAGLLISPAELAQLPTSGTAWTAMKQVADGSLGTANIKDQDNMHGTRVLAVALVWARTGVPSYREKARVHIMAAIGTEVGGRTLALGRNLASYVLAADLIDLKTYSPNDDATFRSWLTQVRTKYIGNHGRWVTLTQTHEDSASNWGAFAGASRIAASLYLGDTADVQRAAQILRGWMGDRSYYAGFRKTAAYDASWACNDAAWVPVNPACVKSNINIDGALVEDISRGGGLAWPPGDTGVMYTSEALRGVYLQAELLHRAGYDTYNWSNKALLRAADFLYRAGWTQPYYVDRWLPWLVNKRYGTSYATRPAAYGRVLGYADWLYP